MKKHTSIVSCLIAPCVAVALFFSSSAHSEVTEECPTNLAPGVYSIQLIVTKSLDTARGVGKKVGRSGWIYESVTGNYVVASGVFEEIQYAKEALQNLQRARRIPKDAYIVVVNLDRVARGVCVTPQNV